MEGSYFVRVFGRIYDYFRPATLADKWEEAETGVRLINNQGYVWTRIQFDKSGNPVVKLGNPVVPPDLTIPRGK